jgi:hypothetical protein
MTRLLPLALTGVLLYGCTATFVLRNERPTAVHKIEIRAADQVLTLDHLAPGAAQTFKLRVRKGGDLNVHYLDDSGRQIYTSAKEPLKKNENRLWDLRLTSTTLLEASVQK